MNLGKKRNTSCSVSRFTHNLKYESYTNQLFVRPFYSITANLSRSPPSSNNTTCMNGFSVPRGRQNLENKEGEGEGEGEIPSLIKAN